jgi:ABC-2 type transport system permease protein
LNIIDALAGENQFLNIRKRRPQHRELTAVSSLLEQAKKDRRDKRIKTSDELDEERKKVEDELNKKIAELEKLEKADRIDQQQIIHELEIAVASGRQQLALKKAEVDQKRDRAYREIETNLAGQVQRVQDRYKLLAVALPPLLPLLIALCVFIVRRSQEGEGVPVERIV